MNIAGGFRSFTAAADAPDLGTRSLVHLRDFLSREWRVIALATALSLAVGAAYVATAPRKYTAQTDMIIDTKKITWTHSDMSAETRTVDDATVETELETTRSERVANAVVRQLNLTKDPEFVGPGHGIKARILALFRRGPEQTPSSDELTRRALSVIKENLRVTRLGRSYVEQIAYTSLDPEKAAKIANTFAEAYIEDQLQAKYEQTRRASEWLEKRIGELRQQASDAYKAVQDFKAENSIIIGVDGKLASDVELDQLGIALAKARADTSQARAKLERIQRVLEQRPNNTDDFSIPDPVVTDALSSPVITKLRQQFLDDQNKQAEWSAKYGANHIAVKNLRAEMAALQNSIWDEISRIAESYKSELQIAKSQEEAIDKRMLEVFQKSGATRQAQVRLRELETGANTYRGIYETFLSRFTQSVQQQSFPSTEARVVTDAPVPRAPSSPKIAITLAFAALCGLGLGVMSAIAREQLLNRQIHTRDQLEKLLGTSCLAVLPAINKPIGKAWGKNSNALTQISEAPPFSATAEALRYIKVAIDLHPTGAKVIGITSALPGEGKTTIAAAFAAFLAKAGARTLLIDADLRRSSLSRVLGHNEGPGLINIIGDGLDFADVVIADPKFKFDVLPSPSALRAPNSADTLNAPAMRNLLKKAAGYYDYVICDLPSVLPVVDVKATAHLFDAFVLVVEWGNTSTNEILNAVRSSPLVSERLLGAVLNKADETFMHRFEGHSDRRYAYYMEEVTGADEISATARN
ncbi:AAA family ATPase [Bradyrhizobium sp. ARR65]|uniref:AAA family ATPase n=1 Tax=Bradyrhizobium sp. ARR65 TaxID=1040989 RepID=UPI000463DF91|nr:AAA family ATPase [Bradyrhizobium sp. ARR65]